MRYTSLGRTGLEVSVAGLGCGGNSRLGQGAGKTAAESVAVVHAALDYGINFFDTAPAYGTEEILGQALAGGRRQTAVVSSKALVRDDGGRLRPAADMVASLERSLRRLQTDYLDVFHLHAVVPETYPYTRDVLVPVLLREREKGKFRHLGITESPPHDPGQQMLQQALQDDCWEVMMVGFHMLNQRARERVFPHTLRQGIGTLLMFVVRNIFSQPSRLASALAELAAAGRIAADLAGPAALDFLLHPGGAHSLPDAAYRYARHQPGADVILFGTGDAAHLAANVESILSPPLPAADGQRLTELFGRLEGVGLDLPSGR